MKIEEIKVLMDMLDDSSLHVLKFKNDDVELVLEKPNVQTVASEVVHLAAPAVQALQPNEALVQEVSQAVQAVAPKADTTDVVAPLVGVFYQAPSPDATPFVKVGEHVEAGDTVCIIEAMKVLNEIKAPVSGKVMSIHADNGDVVEFNQLLMEIGE